MFLEIVETVAPASGHPYLDLYLVYSSSFCFLPVFPHFFVVLMSISSLSFSTFMSTHCHCGLHLDADRSSGSCWTTSEAICIYSLPMSVGGG